ncbi:hypothetical protein GCM10022199_02230 [Marihabitans asiaticum]|uniref:hypothetical protein n=1 Tax=Marihabitans asiaticum TaxID=415218 RepID=UPI0011A44722|nr:hypothetical protein [Marihabitans asiaticum]
MAATAEWSQRAGLVTFTVEPRRWRVISARIVAVTVLSALVVVATLIGSYAVAAAADLAGTDVGYSFEATAIAGSLAMLLLYVLQGVAFGFLLLNTPAAIVIILSLPMAWQVVFGLRERAATLASWLEARRWNRAGAGTQTELGAQTLAANLSQLSAGWFRNQR